MIPRKAEHLERAAIARLAALSPLDSKASAALDQSLRRLRSFRARRELISEGEEILETLLVVNGWAARVHILEDGRRQILNCLLPGDLIGFCDQENPLASSTVIAITDVDVCVAPDASVSPALERAYAHSRALEEAHLLSQITRLGRMNAHERIVDFLLELLERLELAGLALNGRYQMPLTQEIMADALGLTSVHMNRTLQALRREGSLNWKGGEMVLSNPGALRQIVGRAPRRVTAG